MQIHIPQVSDANILCIAADDMLLLHFAQEIQLFHFKLVILL